jgi:hypothetical protein
MAGASPGGFAVRSAYHRRGGRSRAPIRCAASTLASGRWGSSGAAARVRCWRPTASFSQSFGQMRADAEPPRPRIAVLVRSGRASWQRNCLDALVPRRPVQAPVVPRPDRRWVAVTASRSWPGGHSLVGLAATAGRLMCANHASGNKRRYGVHACLSPDAQRSCPSYIPPAFVGLGTRSSAGDR